MEDKKNVFNLTFKGKNGDWDWNFTLYTIEEFKTESEIESLIDYWAEVNSRTGDDYSPVDIIDDLCEDKGWIWTDKEDKLIVITNW